jgi:hypothetical protein
MKKHFALALCPLALACTLLVEGRAPRQSTAVAGGSGVRLRGIDGKTAEDKASAR